MFVWRQHWYPAPGKGAEALALMEEWVRLKRDETVHLSLDTQVFCEGDVHVHQAWFKSLADLEAFRDRLGADVEHRRIMTALRSLTRQPTRGELYRSVIPPTP